MKSWSYKSLYNCEVLLQESARLFATLDDCATLKQARQRLRDTVSRIRDEALSGKLGLPSQELIRVRDCSRALLSVMSRRSDERSGFSATLALWDIACGRPRPDLRTGFFAEMVNWIRGLEGRAEFQYVGEVRIDHNLTGRSAAVVRSAELDRLWEIVESATVRSPSGLSDEAQVLRGVRKEHILAQLGATEDNWNDWNWHVENRVVDPETLARLASVSDEEVDAIEKALKAKLPFAITPYYVSLMDDSSGDRDRAIRAQVIPPHDYVDWMTKHRGALEHSCDFMLESDTSPIDLITRRYPAIVILKPYITCPQICVYCQRNWEIDQSMAPEAMAADEKVEAAIQWIGQHPTVREVLVTGGDPLVLSDGKLQDLMSRLAALPNVELIRLGTRTPVTLPMRITEELAAMLGSFRELGRRDVAVVTHIEHPYEVTMDVARAVDRLKRNGISVYNQHVYTFFVSRRMESAMLRMLIRKIGIDPYYTFAPKGKEETASYRVPLARIFQEQKEEARLIPGLRRTDEAVYNIPGLGKNYLRAGQDRDLVALMPDGSRVYEFHPWEKNLVECETLLTTDVPVLDYLRRLAEIGEDPNDYDSIWFYF
ncbi:MAG: KamA family radical SAM protein [Candidatus Nealsonbacteria bacterium]|nr:KamA family radical SAM protein [Candidatus Nealsonbacteria bacterium]